MRCLRVEDGIRNEQIEDDYFLSKSFYGKSKMDEDFLLILTIFKDENVDITFTVRSKEQSLTNMIMRKVK